MTMVVKRNAIGQCDWPDNDIVIVGRELVEEKKAKKVKSGGSVINEIGGIGVGIARNNLVERMFSCKSRDANMKSKLPGNLKIHKAHVHAMLKGCIYEAKTRSDLKKLALFYCFVFS